MTGQCIAYLDNGRICGKPATILDRQRGGMVCREHASKPEKEIVYPVRECQIGFGKKKELVNGERF